MSKKLVFGLVLSIVLISGSFLSAWAECGCLPRIQLPSCFSGCSFQKDADRDKTAKEKDLAGGTDNSELSSAPLSGEFRYWPIQR